jgi:hypothetical protein
MPLTDELCRGELVNQMVTLWYAVAGINCQRRFLNLHLEIAHVLFIEETSFPAPTTIRCRNNSLP